MSVPIHRSARRSSPIDRRVISNAIVYLVRTGCQWRQLPNNYPKWTTVYAVFRNWRKTAVWERTHDSLRRRVRQSVGKKQTPSAATSEAMTQIGMIALMSRRLAYQ